MSKAPVTMQIYVTGGEEKKKEIIAEAEARNKSVAKLLLDAYEEYLKNHPKDGPRWRV